MQPACDATRAGGARRVLICGHRAFAAQGLEAALRRAGHEVFCFSRGEPGRCGHVISGPVSLLHASPHLEPTFETVVNYVLLRGQSLADNHDYLASLLRLCKERSVRHLIQVSSLSVYRNDNAVITEASPTKNDPRGSGPYAAIKLAAEQFLVRGVSSDLALSVVRPGCIVAPFMTHPIGSAALRLSGNRLLVLASSRCRRAVIVREVLNRAMARLVSVPPLSREVLLLVDRDSPTYAEYLHACCRAFGWDSRVTCVPVLWALAMFRAERQRGAPHFSLRRTIMSVRARWRATEYDPTWSESRLGFSLSADWRKALCHEDVPM